MRLTGRLRPQKGANSERGSQLGGFWHTRVTSPDPVPFIPAAPRAAFCGRHRVLFQHSSERCCLSGRAPGTWLHPHRATSVQVAGCASRPPRCREAVVPWRRGSGRLCSAFFPSLLQPWGCQQRCHTRWCPCLSVVLWWAPCRQRAEGDQRLRFVRSRWTEGTTSGIAALTSP